MSYELAVIVIDDNIFNSSGKTKRERNREAQKRRREKIADILANEEHKDYGSVKEAEDKRKAKEAEYKKKQRGEKVVDRHGEEYDEDISANEVREAVISHACPTVTSTQSSASIPLDETERSGDGNVELAAQLAVLEKALQDGMHQLNARDTEVEALKDEIKSLRTERSLLLSEVEEFRSNNFDYSGAIQDALETEELGTTCSNTVYDTLVSTPGRMPFRPTTGLSARISVAVFEAFNWAKSQNTLGAGSCTLCYHVVM